MHQRIGVDHLQGCHKGLRQLPVSREITDPGDQKGSGPLASGHRAERMAEATVAAGSSPEGMWSGSGRNLRRTSSHSSTRPSMICENCSSESFFSEFTLSLLCCQAETGKTLSPGVSAPSFPPGRSAHCSSARDGSPLIAGEGILEEMSSDSSAGSAARAPNASSTADPPQPPRTFPEHRVQTSREAVPSGKRAFQKGRPQQGICKWTVCKGTVCKGTVCKWVLFLKGLCRGVI